MANEDKPITQAHLQEALAGVQASLSEQMRDIETALLKAFHGYAQGTAAQLQKLNGADGAAEIRLSALESRVLELETRRRL